MADPDAVEFVGREMAKYVRPALTPIYQEVSQAKAAVRGTGTYLRLAVRVLLTPPIHGFRLRDNARFLTEASDGDIEEDLARPRALQAAARAA